MGNILLILVLIALNGFFVAVEFSTVSSRRSRLEAMGIDDGKAAQSVRRWMENPAMRDRLIAAAQVGITLVSLALGAVGVNTFEAWLKPLLTQAILPERLAFLEKVIPIIPLVLTLLIVGGLHVVLGEQVPKAAVLRAPEKFALWSAALINGFGKIFKGFIGVLDWGTRLVLGLLGLPPDSPRTAEYSLDEIRQIVNSSEVNGVMQEPEREMISAVIDFGDLLVRQIFTPRTEIVAVQAGMPVREVIELAVDSSHTKLPVYEDSIDQITGIVHLQDLVLDSAKHRSNGRAARDVMREALFVPETISVNKLLHQFKIRKKRIAIVLDEYGGTSGVVTLGDLVEEILGVIDDPFETDPPAIQNLPDGSFLLDGLSLIEDVNSEFDLDLQDSDYDTIAGFMLGRLGRLAEVGDAIEEMDEKIRLQVAEMDGLRIARIKLSFLPQASLHIAEAMETTEISNTIE